MSDFQPHININVPSCQALFLGSPNNWRQPNHRKDSQNPAQEQPTRDWNRVKDRGFRYVSFDTAAPKAGIQRIVLAETFKNTWFHEFCSFQFVRMTLPYRNFIAIGFSLVFKILVKLNNIAFRQDSFRSSIEVLEFLEVFGSQVVAND